MTPEQIIQQHRAELLDSITQSLIAAAANMDRISEGLRYLGGFNAEWHDKADQLQGAASIARQWAASIDQGAFNK